ncbi:MAG: HsdR family type I site-specific deoxyribonuclease, partial [Proteobacteria bacterium]|nr:HsdR family type I site-specific deoxyribonuclease [Pseudomonadota bacterium]
MELSEKKALEVFGKLGYGYAYGPEIAPDGPKAERESFKEVVLTGRLAKAIKKFNPWISDNNLKKAMREITHVEARNLVEANSIIHEKLVRHISLAQDLGEGKKKQTVRFIDWEKPERNEFLVVNQFKVAGPKENIIPDIVVFVNGIPFGVIECKNPTTYEPEEKAIKQLLRYQNLREPDTHEGAERLFYPNQVVVAAWSESASCCTVGGWYNHYRMWKDPYPITEKELKDFLGRKPKGQDILIYSIFRKDHLLDLVRNFIVFEPEGEALVKKLARYQQFRAVNKAIAAIEKSKEWKGGTIWHTQGSGKSLSMLYLAVKLRRMKKLENPVIVIMTDRKDLDKQITGTFERCGFPNPERATSIVDLRDRLSAGPGVTTMTTIQKFQERVEGQHPVLSKASNIFVMVDEAHRSQYKDLATNVRTALPNARYLAFTGTPIEQRKRNTRQTFGDYIDTYTIEESVADGATVPIHYQGRLADVWVEGRNLDEIFDRVFADKSKKERELIKQRYANEKTIAEARERIKQICLDLIKHYETVIAPNGFKAQVVTVSREAAATYKEILDELNGPESAVIISGDHNDPERLKKHHLT